MEKPAVTNEPLNDLIRRRWSPRAFDPRPVETDKLRTILEAARWAPSAMNEQPWSFVVAARDQEAEFEALLGCLVDANRAWARNAGALILTVARLRYSRDGRKNRSALHDVGLATENLLLQAVDLGLVAHAAGGFDAARAREAFAIPEEHAPVAMVILGYPGDPMELSEPLRERELAPRTRRPLEEIVFTGRWGTPGLQI